MKITNKYHNLLKYAVDESYIHHENKHRIVRLGCKLDYDIEIIKPTVTVTTNIYERSEREANVDITYLCSFFSLDLKKTIIKYKGLLSFDSVTENQDKDYLDLKEIYEEGHKHMKDFIIKNSLKYAECIEFHPYRFTEEKDCLKWLGFYKDNM
jgi:hypothetical protein